MFERYDGNCLIFVIGPVLADSQEGLGNLAHVSLFNIRYK